jgi:hypothetical protein
MEYFGVCDYLKFENLLQTYIRSEFSTAPVFKVHKYLMEIIPNEYLTIHPSSNDYVTKDHNFSIECNRTSC